jgi:hypothetical protein
MTKTGEIFKNAHEAAILILSHEAGGMTEDRRNMELPEGCAALCPLDADGVMCDRKGRLVAVYATELDKPQAFGFLSFLDKLELAANGVAVPGRVGTLVTCSPSDVRFAGLYDLDRRVITSLIQPNLLEDWADEDRDQLCPEFAVSGTTDPEEHRRLSSAGVITFDNAPGIAQLSNGQVLVEAANGDPTRIYSFDDPNLLKVIEAMRLPSKVKLRLLGRSDQPVSG